MEDKNSQTARKPINSEINAQIINVSRKKTVVNGQERQVEVKLTILELEDNEINEPNKLNEKEYENPQKKESTKKEIYQKEVSESEDTCEKCPMRTLVFIPICFGYVCLGFFDFIAYLIVPIGMCLFYAISFICNSCKNVISSYQVEEEIGFSGAFTSENEIKLHINNEGGAFHLTEILCFSYMSACIKRYFCAIFVLINHIIVPVMHAWYKAKKCFLSSKVEELYDERVKKIEEESTYKGYDQSEPKIEVNNI